MQCSEIRSLKAEGMGGTGAKDLGAGLFNSWMMEQTIVWSKNRVQSNNISKDESLFSAPSEK